MNRRSFITSMLAAAVAPMALKGAGRVWKSTGGIWVLNPDYVNAPLELTYTTFDFAKGPRMVTSCTLPFLGYETPRRFDAQGNEVPIHIFTR